MNVVVLSPLCAIAGFLFKWYVDKFTQHKQKVKDKKIKDLEYKLKKFYFPLYSNLKTETILSNSFVNAQENVVFELEKFVLEAHVANQALIRKHMVRVNPVPTMHRLLTAYSDHITVYKLRHDTAKDDFLVMFSKKIDYPKELFVLIETEVDHLRAELDKAHNSMV
jgi:hypothetical protein